MTQRSRSQVKVKCPKSTKWTISRMLFHLQTLYLVPRYNPIRHIQWPKCRLPWPKVKVKGQGQIFPKMHKKQRTGHISEAISLTDIILGNKVQPNKAHSMTQVPMTLTEGQGQRSRSNFPKMLKKKHRTGHISEAISTTHFILVTKVQPNKAHSMTQVPMTLTRSKSNFPPKR